MAAVTAITFIGNAHPNCGGIRPVDTIEFAEGGSPYFEFGEKNGRRDRLILIPTIENTLDDLLLFIAYYIVEHPEVVSVVNTLHGKKIRGERIEMYSEFTHVQRNSLYEKVMPLQDLPKVAICLFESSHLAKSIHHIQQYSVECEVCTSTFRRSFSSWTKTWESTGSFY